MGFIAKILPVDGYTVALRGDLPVDYTLSLTHLYQPIIGSKPVMLYLTLLNEIDFLKGDEVQTHHTLMNYLCLPLDEIYESRIKLEAIGLLQTFEDKKEGNATVYEYMLQIPYTPKMFLADSMLSPLLYAHIGKQKFAALEKHYEKKTNVRDVKEITASFNDVFDTVKPIRKDDSQFHSTTKPAGPNIAEIDFSYLQHMLKQRMIPVHKVLTAINRRIISQMATLYQLTSYEIENCLLWSLTADNELDEGAFKSACHDLFRTSQGQSYIRLQDKQQTVTEIDEKRQSPSHAMTKEEKLIQELENISPQQLLADLSKGKQASAQDMKVISDVMTSQGLPSPVMNVLIHYVLLQTDMKLSKAYLETIASHWSRANLQTAKEAMAFAKRQQQNKYKAVKKPAKYQQYTKKARVVPDWIQDNHKHTKPSEDPDTKVNVQKEKDELLAFINQYADKKKNNYSQG